MIEPSVLEQPKKTGYSLVEGLGRIFLKAHLPEAQNDPVLQLWRWVGFERFDKAANHNQSSFMSVLVAELTRREGSRAPMQLSVFDENPKSLRELEWRDPEQVMGWLVTGKVKCVRRA